MVCTWINGIRIGRGANTGQGGAGTGWEGGRGGGPNKSDNTGGVITAT